MPASPQSVSTYRVSDRQRGHRTPTGGITLTILRYADSVPAFGALGQRRRRPERLLRGFPTWD